VKDAFGRKWWLKTYRVIKVVFLLFFFTEVKVVGDDACTDLKKIPPGRLR
jgi:hypothetical protein